MEDVLKKLGYLEEEEKEVAMTEAEAVRLIQIHERARQGETEGREGGVYDGEVFFFFFFTEEY